MSVAVSLTFTKRGGRALDLNLLIPGLNYTDVANVPQISAVQIIQGVSHLFLAHVNMLILDSSEIFCSL